MTPEELFVSQLALIERVIASICRRHAFFGDEAEDFAAWVKLKLVEGDYAVLRKFQGKSLLKTYLTAVVGNYYRDYLIKKCGKWRPSVAARRRGPVAIQLEELIYRDGYSEREAIEILKRNFQVETPRQELEKFAAVFPQRPPRRFVGEETLRRHSVDGDAEERVADRERAAVAERVEAALAAALGRLPAEDRLLLQQKFDGFKISTLARQMGVKQRSLYSRVERLLRELGAALRAEGLDEAEVRKILDWRALELEIGFGDGSGNGSQGKKGSASV